MAGDKAFASRAMWAFQEVQQRKRPEKFSQGDLAVRVNDRTGRTFTQAAANGWLAGSVPKELETMDALALSLECDHMWLYFERGVAPAGWEEHRRGLASIELKTIEEASLPVAKLTRRKKSRRKKKNVQG